MISGVIRLFQRNSCMYNLLLLKHLQQFWHWTIINGQTNNSITNTHIMKTVNVSRKCRSLMLSHRCESPTPINAFTAQFVSQQDKGMLTRYKAHLNSVIRFMLLKSCWEKIMLIDSHFTRRTAKPVVRKRDNDIQVDCREVATIRLSGTRNKIIVKKERKHWFKVFW